jgi:hypothetical protein
MRFVLVVLCAAFLHAQQNDWLIVPGERLGPIPTDITRAGLDRLLGKDKVHDQEVDTGEGPEPVTVVFSETPGAALAILWRDSRTIRQVMICFPPEDHPCKWHTKDGISFGISLDRLEKLNGRAFQIEPWGSDIGGWVISWQGGKLATRDGPNNSLGLRLDFPTTSGGSTPRQQRLLDDLKRHLLSSDLSGLQLHSVVIEMTLGVVVTTAPPPHR